MWMKSRFASWEVEGQVRERVHTALCEAEQRRLLQTARNATARPSPVNPFRPLYAAVRRLARHAQAPSYPAR
jgi:hypothetical protein